MSKRSSLVVPWWAPLSGGLLGLTPRVLAGEEIDQALTLLYEVYVLEQGWEPAQPNASGLYIDHDKRQLTDDLVDDAVWVGVFRGEMLVGVTRLIARSRFGKLEIERYVSLPEELMAVDGEVIEANRLCVHRDFRTSWVLLVLQLAAERVGRQLGAVRSLAAMTPGQAARLERNLGWHRAGVSFRYHPDEPRPVEIVRFDKEDLAPVRTLGIMARRQWERLLRRVGLQQRIVDGEARS